MLEFPDTFSFLRACSGLKGQRKFCVRGRTHKVLGLCEKICQILRGFQGHEGKFSRESQTEIKRNVFNKRFV